MLFAKRTSKQDKHLETVEQFIEKRSAVKRGKTVEQATGDLVLRQGEQLALVAAQIDREQYNIWY